MRRRIWWSCSTCPTTSPPAAVNRARDRLEAEGDAFHRAVRDAYRAQAEEQGWVLVDGDGAPEEVAGRIWGAVAGLLPG